MVLIKLYLLLGVGLVGRIESSDECRFHFGACFSGKAMIKYSTYYIGYL